MNMPTSTPAAPHQTFMPHYALDDLLQRDVADLTRDMQGINPPVVTEADLEALPTPVQHYLRAAQIIGKPRTLFARCRFKGEFRRTPQEKWMPMVCEQYNRIDQPNRLWYAMMQFMPLMTFYVRDSYRQGEGNMYARLTRWYKMFDERSPELTQAELVILLNDMVFFPSALLSAYVRWEAVDDHAARAYLTTSGQEVSAVFHFDEQYDVVNFVGERYKTGGKAPVLTTWTTPFEKHRKVNGVRIPTAGRATWQQDSGPFNYVRVSLVDVQDNVCARYP